ncbi:phosphoglycolate phosphatase [Parafrankia colletiae]|uniref:Phosphoglycolate phosphatase n=1 Tax=Parafrankia colletiae TaxID=573497 RepID=A0A1S1QMD0_9ACTN|nr:phosphoglycolate phosphatase [Parafrankia colletiae]
MDLDGVIVDSFDVMREAFEIAYREVVGVGDAPFEEYHRHQGRYFPDIMRIMNLPGAMEEPFVRESHRLRGEVRVYDGVAELLGALRGRGFGLAVATGKSGPRARDLLDHLGLLHWFHHVVGSDEIARPKPAPDIVERALLLLETPPDQALMVGDAANDLRSAQGAGVRSAAALWGTPDEADLLRAGPDIVLRRPADLLAVLPERSARAR